MARAINHNRVYEQLAELREERAALLPVVEALPEVRRLRGLDAAISGLQQYAEATRQRNGATTVAAPQDSQFAHLSLPKAGVKYIELYGPQTDEELWDGLSSAGVTLRARRPVHAVHKALEKHQNKNQWLQYVDGKWSLRQPDPAKGGIAGGDLKKHKRLTSEGIAHFKARSGASWGRRPLITAAQIEKFRELYDSGKYTVAAASRESGMSNAYFYMHREAMLAWRKGDTWPPPRGLVDEQKRAPDATQPRLKLVGDDE